MKTIIFWIIFVFILVWLISLAETPKNEPESERIRELLWVGASVKASVIPAWFETKVLGVMTITGYSSTPEETWGDPFITASGQRVKEGIIACPKWLSFGTRVIVGDREYICEDRMSKKFPERFDIWFEDTQEAKNWGVQEWWVEIVD